MHFSLAHWQDLVHVSWVHGRYYICRTIVNLRTLYFLSVQNSHVVKQMTNLRQVSLICEEVLPIINIEQECKGKNAERALVVNLKKRRHE